jgi:hypothetical protein
MVVLVKKKKKKRRKEGRKEGRKEEAGDCGNGRQMKTLSQNL